MPAKIIDFRRPLNAGGGYGRPQKYVLASYKNVFLSSEQEWDICKYPSRNLWVLFLVWFFSEHLHITELHGSKIACMHITAVTMQSWKYCGLERFHFVKTILSELTLLFKLFFFLHLILEFLIISYKNNCIYTISNWICTNKYHKNFVFPLYQTSISHVIWVMQPLLHI